MENSKHIKRLTENKKHETKGSHPEIQEMYKKGKQNKRQYREIQIINEEKGKRTPSLRIHVRVASSTSALVWRDMVVNISEHHFLTVDGGLKCKQLNYMGLVLELKMLKRYSHFRLEGLHGRWENKGKLRGRGQVRVRDPSDRLGRIHFCLPTSGFCLCRLSLLLCLFIIFIGTSPKQRAINNVHSSGHIPFLTCKINFKMLENIGK